MKLVGDLAMVLIVLTDLNPRGAFKRFLAWPTFLLVPLSVLFIKYIPSLGRGYTRWTNEPVFIGVTYNKNLLGIICVVWGLGLIWSFREELRDRTVTAQSFVISGVLLAMVLWLLKTAHSATSLGCFAIGCFLMIWTSIPVVARRPLLVHIAAAATIGVSFAVLFGGVGTDALDVLGKDSTLTGRTELWEKLFKMTDNPILGTGFESFWLGPRLETLWAQYWWQPNQAHNGYIEAYINLGWIGVAALVAMIVTAYRRSVAAIYGGDQDGSLRLAYVVIAIIHNFTEASFRMQNLVWIIFLFALIGIPMRGALRARGSAARSKLRVVPVTAVRRKAGELVGAGASRQYLGRLHPEIP
jgi:O-antigen ligase